MTWVYNLFYQMYKDYGTKATYFKIGKANIDHDTGLREDERITKQIKVVLTPKMIQSEFIKQLLGKNEYSETYFLTLKSELAGIAYDTTDYIIHNQQRFGDLKFDDILDCVLIGCKAVTTALPYNVTQQNISDTLELNDANL